MKTYEIHYYDTRYDHTYDEGIKSLEQARAQAKSDFDEIPTLYMVEIVERTRHGHTVIERLEKATDEQVELTTAERMELQAEYDEHVFFSGGSVGGIQRPLP